MFSANQSKFLIALLGFSSLGFQQNAHAQNVHPNNCYDGPVYRALNGPNVKLNGHGDKSLIVNQETLIACQVGNSTSCAGATYNDYNCSFYFSQVTGSAAAAVFQNLNTPTDANGTKSIVVSWDYAFDSICVHYTMLSCDSSSCAFKPYIDCSND